MSEIPEVQKLVMLDSAQMLSGTWEEWVTLARSIVEHEDAKAKKEPRSL